MYILYIESSTTVCSVAVSSNEKIIALKEINDGFKHAELLTVFIESVLSDAQIKTSNINYIALSIGPGSYTGLRIGASVAKGISYALNIPIVGIDSLTVIADNARCIVNDVSFDYIVPMIDARRMEVYQCVFDKSLISLSNISPLILDEQSYAEYLKQGRCLFVGNSNEKAKTVLNHPNAEFKEITSSAVGLVNSAIRLIEKQEFLDTAYFEPVYLKQFGEK